MQIQVLTLHEALEILGQTPEKQHPCIHTQADAQNYFSEELMRLAESDMDEYDWMEARFIRGLSMEVGQGLAGVPICIGAP